MLMAVQEVNLQVEQRERISTAAAKELKQLEWLRAISPGDVQFMY